MTSYTLIEYKLRRYIYLGNEYSIYIPPSIRTSYCEKKHQDDITGVRMIGKIVKKNNSEQINSIVPIILKIKKEDKLHDDRLLIFALAICARFNLDQCKKMITDAYAAVSFICTDGLKLLMFVKFCKDVRSILQTEGYLPNKSSSFGNDFRKAISNWYLSNDSLQTTEMIVRHRSYYGWTHRDVMNLIHIHSEDPTHQIFIMYTMCGMAKVEKEFESKLKDVKIDNISESYENKQLTFIYNFLKQVHNLQKLDDKELKNEIELNRWGHMLEVIPRHKLKNINILTSLVKHMPLKILLENTFYFAKQRLFFNSTPDVGLWEYIFRFNNLVQLQKSRIHPIESYIEYIRYSRTSQNILTMQNNILKKQKYFKTNKLPDNKFVLLIETTKKMNMKNDDFSQTTNKSSNMSSKQEYNTTALSVTNESKIKDSKPKLHLNESKHKSTKCGPTKSKSNQILNETEVLEKQNQMTESPTKLSLKTNIQENNLGKTVTNKIQSEVINVDQNPSNIILMTPTPKLVMQLMTFLSEDLVKKTLENLKPSGRRIIIVYDSRLCMRKKKCVCTHLLNVDEAITLLTLSLIYPDKLPNKPTIYALKEPDKQYKNEIIIDYSQPLTFAYLQSILFEEQFDLKSEHKDIASDINPLSIMDWARQHNKEYDVFVFLGTNKMNLKNAIKYIKEYRAFLKKPIKVIICCLNGKHTDQISLGRGNMLFIVGFDRNIGKIIDSFINAEF